MPFGSYYKGREEPEVDQQSQQQKHHAHVKPQPETLKQPPGFLKLGLEFDFLGCVPIRWAGPFICVFWFIISVIEAVLVFPTDPDGQVSGDMDLTRPVTQITFYLTMYLILTGLFYPFGLRATIRRDVGGTRTFATFFSVFNALGSFINTIIYAWYASRFQRLPNYWNINVCRGLDCNDEADYALSKYRRQFQTATTAMAFVLYGIYLYCAYYMLVFVHECREEEAARQSSERMDLDEERRVAAHPHPQRAARRY